MKGIFADTSFYIAAANPADRLHAVATNFARGYRGTIVTTEYVLLEVANFLSRATQRRLFVEMWGKIESDPASTVLASSHDSWRRGLDLYLQRPDKDWSLTDCISFVTMEEHGLTEALTADHHFEQAGFSILLR